MNEFVSARGKIIEVEAMQWDGTIDGILSLVDWINPFGHEHDDPIVDYTIKNVSEIIEFVINTHYGAAIIELNDWILHGPDGEFYLFSNQEFELLFTVTTKAYQQPTFLEQNSTTFDSERKS